MMINNSLIKKGKRVNLLALNRIFGENISNRFIGYHSSFRDLFINKTSCKTINFMKYIEEKR